MQALLASLAACDVDLVAMHAALLGVTIESLTVEARAHFNVSSYLGIEDGPGRGYGEIGYRARLKAPEISEEQIALLPRRCGRRPPVGDTLMRTVPVEFGVELQ